MYAFVEWSVQLGSMTIKVKVLAGYSMFTEIGSNYGGIVILDLAVFS